MTKPNFFLGLGCQKGGSSWLHDYLASRTDTAMSSPKELHFFNTILDPKNFSGTFKTRLELFEQTLIGKSTSEIVTEKIGAEHLRLLQMYYEHDDYIRYFETLSEPNHVQVVGECTPCYSQLSAKNMATARDFLERHFNLSTVFLLRDPIERIYSFIRMRIRDTSDQEHGKRIPEQIFAENFNSPFVEKSTRYETMIPNIDQVFGPGSLYYGFYETLFTDKTIRDICAFLKIPFETPDYGKRVNATKPSNPLPKDVLKAARAYYDTTYQFCAERFGEEFIASHWPHYSLGR